MTSLVQRYITGWLVAGSFGLLVRKYWLRCSRSKSRRDLIYQIYFIGVKSQTVVLVTGAFTGMVLAAQAYYPIPSDQNGHRHAGVGWRFDV